MWLNIFSAFHTNQKSCNAQLHRLSFTNEEESDAARLCPIGTEGPVTPRAAKSEI